MFFDSHCHLDFPDFQTDLAEVLARAKNAGVTKILNPGCTLTASRRAVALASVQENIFAAVGVHPHDASEVDERAIEELEKLAENQKVVAIGEIGLDYFRLNENQETRINQQELNSKFQIPNSKQISNSKIQNLVEEKKLIQQKAFRLQLELAQKLNQPIIVHSRDSDDDTLAILSDFPELKGVFHCFGGGVEFAWRVLERNFYLGITGIVTFPNAENIRDVVRVTPLENLLIETDAPYLAPVPHRGKRNEPAYVLEVARKIAEIKDVSVEEVAEITMKNAEELFGLVCKPVK